MKNNFIHPTAIVESKNIGTGTRIWAFVHILEGASIGKNVNICDYCFIENKVVIGNNVTIKSGVYLWDSLIIEDNVMIGPAVVFTNDRYPRSKNREWIEDKILLKTGCSIGANSTILPKVTIGQYAMIGAGSIITKDVPDFALVYGNPAKIKNYVCICTKKLDFVNEKSICICGRKYNRIHNQVIPKR